jgi:hypothetical protein
MSSPVVFTLDTVAPTVSITTTGGLTNQASQTISGTVTDTVAAPASTVTLYDNGSTTPLATATLQSNGSWSTSVTLSGDGTHSIVAEDTDAAGNTGISSPVVFTLDTVLPTVSITTTGGLTNQASQTISGTVTDTGAATVTLYDNGSTTPLATATLGSNGSWSTSVTFSGDGTHSIVAEDTDAAGNTGISSPVVFTLDTVPPTFDHHDRWADQPGEPDHHRDGDRHGSNDGRHGDALRQWQYHAARNRHAPVEWQLEHAGDAGERHQQHRRQGHRCR